MKVRVELINQEHYDKASKDLFKRRDDFTKLGGEERDHELILLSLFKAMDGAKSYQLLERMLNDLFDFLIDL